MSSTKQSAFEAGIVDTCSKHKQAHWKEDGYRACVTMDTVHFVKFGSPQTLWPEIATQSHIFEYAQSHADAPRIPKVILHFEYQRTMYMVMEAITLMEPPPDLPERTAEALRWLSGVPAPADHEFGLLGGGLIRHSFFKDYKAPLVFSSIEALERYMEKVRAYVDVVEIGEEPDIHPSNFGVDEHGNTVLMDFGEIAMLPESFAAYTLSSNRHAALATSLGLSSSSKVGSMACISSFLWIVSDPTLGLDEDGYPKTSSRKR